MPNPRLANRYAKSLIDIAVERAQLEAAYADMKYLENVCRASRDFRNLLKSPVIKADQKGKIIDAVINGNVSALTTAFISLLVKKGRESELLEIANAFVDQYNVLKGIHKVKLTTAAPMSEELKKNIETKIRSERGLDKIELETAVDEKLIGGFVLEFDDNLVDASIQRDLKDIRKQFSQNLYVHSIH
ncbi:ATP synthase F1 subunit delta [Sediminibacterium soli]|uniref:ATP synthase F1 subunit delta n=1 Tax=Sediminibacterium soli TaxID=2698829 RepID=UPI001379A613|nr:ATP synthase F1 subunit delta [Sediminibacterium soli]NCI45479.1 ATP synthase F1 subunit delta [Sediminibacterium soli]